MKTPCYTVWVRHNNAFQRFGSFLTLQEARDDMHSWLQYMSPAQLTQDDVEIRFEYV